MAYSQFYDFFTFGGETIKSCQENYSFIIIFDGAKWQ